MFNLHLKLRFGFDLFWHAIVSIGTAKAFLFAEAMIIFTAILLQRVLIGEYHVPLFIRLWHDLRIEVCDISLKEEGKQL